MPTLHRSHGIRYVIWMNDHMPAHVHAFGSDWEIKVGLGDCESIKPWLMEISGGDPTARELRLVLQTANERCTEFVRKWREIHG